MVTFGSQHLKRIKPGAAPGGMYVRMVTGTDVVLREHVMGEDESTDLMDSIVAENYRAEHPEQGIWVYIYDGDTGECEKTIVLPGVGGS